MKMAERQNILAMGLDPDEVISFGGGWVNHAAPEAFRQAIRRSSATRRSSTRAAATPPRSATSSAASSSRAFEAHLFGVPRLGAEHIAIGAGSTQLTHDLFRTLLDPGDTVMLLDPTYANYEGQLAFAAPGVAIVRLPVIDPATWTYLPVTDPGRRRSRLPARCSTLHQPRLVLFGAPDNPTSQILPQALADAMLRAHRATPAPGWPSTSPTSASTSQTPPAYYAWSPADHPQRHRHPLELEVGPRPGPAARLD